MTDRTRAVVSWSGGKDAALMLWELLADSSVRVVELLTTVGEETGRSSMHGVRRELYDRQATAVGLPIRYVELPERASNDEYEERMAAVTADYAERGVDAFCFGDIRLEDVRAYREDRLDGTGIDGLWPLWGRDTGALARTVVEAGFRATVVCVDGDRLDPSFLGRAFDAGFLDDLPDDVDPCGEDGEFHTFVHGGPGFAEPIPVDTGETVTRESGDAVFHYLDLEAADDGR